MLLLYLRREGELDNRYLNDIGGLHELEGAYRIIHCPSLAREYFNVKFVTWQGDCE